MTHWSDKLKDLGACESAYRWASSQPSLKIAWKECERADWMLWLIGRLSGEPESPKRKLLIKCLNKIVHENYTLSKKTSYHYNKILELRADIAHVAFTLPIFNVAFSAAVITDRSIANSNPINTLKIIRKYYPEAPKL